MQHVTPVGDLLVVDVHGWASIRKKNPFRLVRVDVAVNELLFLVPAYPLEAVAYQSSHD